MTRSDEPDVATVVLALRQLVTEAAKATPLLVRQPWEFVGISRSAWFRLASAGLTPKPVKLEGVGVAYRRLDLEEFVRKLKT